MFSSYSSIEALNTLTSRFACMNAICISKRSGKETSSESIRNYGRTYMGMIRSTYLLDEDGKILRIWPKVRVKGHVDEVREKIAEL